MSVPAIFVVVAVALLIFGYPFWALCALGVAVVAAIV